MSTSGLFESEFFFASPEKSEPTTRFFPIAPRNIGTGDVESFKSFFLNLAIKHRVTPLTLALQLAEFSEIKLSSAQFSFWTECRTFNCAAEMPKWIDAMGTAVGRDDLSLTSFEPINKLIAAAGLTRSKRHVCVECCREDLAKGNETSYGRLLWTIASVTCCPLHRSKLVSADACPEFKLHRRIGGVNAYGVCFHCQRLGYKCLDISSESPTQAELAHANQCRDLIAIFKDLRFLTTENMKRSVAEFAANHGGMAELARSANISKSSLSRWINVPTARFSLELLASICSAMKTSISNLIFGDLSRCLDLALEAPRCNRRPMKKLDPDFLASEMMSALRVGESLASVEKRLGVTRRTLRKYHPTIYAGFNGALIGKHARGELKYQKLIADVAAILRQLLLSSQSPTDKRVLALTGKTWQAMGSESTVLILLRRELGDERVRIPTISVQLSKNFLSEIARQAEKLRQEFGMIFKSK